MAIDPVGSVANAGIQRGDVIEQVNQQPVRTVAELRDAVPNFWHGSCASTC